MTLTWGWALYVVVPFLLFVAVLVGVLTVVRRFWRWGRGRGVNSRDQPLTIRSPCGYPQTAGHCSRAPVVSWCPR